MIALVTDKRLRSRKYLVEKREGRWFLLADLSTRLCKEDNQKHTLRESQIHWTSTWIEQHADLKTEEVFVFSIPTKADLKRYQLVKQGLIERNI